MIIFYQIRYAIKRVLVDVQPFIAKLVSTLLVTALLGLAFSSSMEPKMINKSIILYSIDEQDGYEQIVNSLAKSGKVKEFASFEKADSQEKALQEVEKNRAFAYIHVKADGTFQIYCKSYYGLIGNNTKLIMKNIEQTLGNLGYCYAEGDVEGYAESVDASVSVKDVKDPKTSTAMQYYSIAMLLMLILYGNEYGAIFVGEDYMGALGDRLKLSPIKAWQQYFGKIIGLSIVVVIESTIMILFTKFVYHVYWGNDFPMLYYIIITNALLVTTMGAMFIILTKDFVKADTISTICIIGFTFLAGGFFIADFGIFKYLSPSYYARVAINTVIFGGDYRNIHINVGIMWAITFACAAISIFAARRKRT